MTNLSSAYGHAIARLGELNSAKAFTYLATEIKRAPAVMSYDGTKQVLPERWVPGCSGQKCDEPPVYVTRYLYVTGRAGRVTDRIQYCCQAHGEAFAKKHRLTLEPAP